MDRRRRRWFGRRLHHLCFEHQGCGYGLSFDILAPRREGVMGTPMDGPWARRDLTTHAMGANDRFPAPAGDDFGLNDDLWADDRRGSTGKTVLAAC